MPEVGVSLRINLMLWLEPVKRTELWNSERRLRSEGNSLWLIQCPNCSKGATTDTSPIYFELVAFTEKHYAKVKTEVECHPVGPKREQALHQWVLEINRELDEINSRIDRKVTSLPKR